MEVVDYSRQYTVKDGFGIEQFNNLRFEGISVPTILIWWDLLLSMEDRDSDSCVFHCLSILLSECSISIPHHPCV